MNIQYFIKMILVGLVQGLTEPLPISSSAHMILLENILNVNINNINFEILINLASCLAITIFFRKKIYYLIKNTFTKYPTKYPHLNRSFLLKLIISSIPITITGFLLKDHLNIFYTSTFFIGAFLLITSLMLFFTCLMIERKKIMTDEINYHDSIIIGLMQSIAIVPGISRSCTTFFSGTSRNVKLKLLFDYSFFLYIIASFGSLVLSFFDFNLVNFLQTQNFLVLFITFVVTFGATLLSITIFHKIMSTKLFYLFCFYTLLLGLFLVIYNLLLLIPIHQ